MDKFVYDFETFPNFCSCSFVSVDTKEITQFVIWEQQNDTEKMLDFVNRSIRLIGYNSKNYDAPLLRYISLYHGRNINEDIFKMSQQLIDDDRRNDKDIIALRYHKEGFPWHDQDLMAMLGYDKIGVSLKLCAIALDWKKIQDIPLPYNHLVKQKDELRVLVATDVLSEGQNLQDCCVVVNYDLP